MLGRCFLDTNVFVYALDDRDQRKKSIASELIERGIAEATAVTSTQVAVEFANVANRHREPHIIAEAASLVLDMTIRSMIEAPTSIDDILAADRICRTHSLSFFDALIVSAAIEHGCEVIYSEDMQHGQVIKGVKIINPFLEVSGPSTP